MSNSPVVIPKPRRSCLKHSKLMAYCADCMQEFKKKESVDG